MAGAKFVISLTLLIPFFSLSSAIPPHIYKSFSSAIGADGPAVRVLVGKGMPELTVSGKNLQRKLLPVSRKETFLGNKKIRFQCARFAERNQSHSLGRFLLASVESSSGLVGLERDQFEGSLFLVANTASRSCDVVNEISMERYLSSLLSREMNSSWPIEALKAQAVAARTYAIHKMKSQEVSKIRGEDAFYDLENSERHQVSGSFQDTTPETIRASLATRGEILVTRQGELLTPTFFHASCGGRTREPQKVWSNRVKGYQETDCDFCENRRGQYWSKELSVERMQKFFLWAYENNLIEGVPENPKGQMVRIVPSEMKDPKIRVYFGDKLSFIKKNTFRRYFGRVKFPSTHFSIKFDQTGWDITGRGNGHGVGMCQVGALDLARQGWDYRRILAHYYPGHKLKSLY